MPMTCRARERPDRRDIASSPVPPASLVRRPRKFDFRRVRSRVYRARSGREDNGVSGEASASVGSDVVAVGLFDRIGSPTPVTAFLAVPSQEVKDDRTFRSRQPFGSVSVVIRK